MIESHESLDGACSAKITLKEVGVPLTGMGLAAATDWEPATGMGAVSPAPVSPQLSTGDDALSKLCNSVTGSQQRSSCRKQGMQQCHQKSAKGITPEVRYA